ncbi:hypothetical protein [Vibrio methylphosphonaticus]|uniref:hypothetical protein n=1 Tax=Vibrio methylphosphonaticus TaxID=2946866 RepID=UPI002029F0DB|nr:hypothetical protein [Vibrio methylphosphonaticus]MCL9773572.1 hypothetical protein [Vibrio methylphosphonaticus]
MDKLIETLRAEAPDFKKEVATYKANLMASLEAQHRTDTFKYHTKSATNTRQLVTLTAELTRAGYEVDASKLVVFPEAKGFKLYYKRTDAEISAAIKQGKLDINQQVKEYRQSLVETWINEQVEQTLQEQAKDAEKALKERQETLKQQLLEALSK